MIVRLRLDTHRTPNQPTENTPRHIPYPTTTAVTLKQRSVTTGDTQPPLMLRNPHLKEPAGRMRSRVESAALHPLVHYGKRVRVCTRHHRTHAYLPHTWVGARGAGRENRGQWMKKGEGNRGEGEAHRGHRASADFQPHHPRDTITPSFFSTSWSSSLVSRRRYCSAANLERKKKCRVSLLVPNSTIHHQEHLPASVRHCKMLTLSKNLSDRSSN